MRKRCCGTGEQERPEQREAAEHIGGPLARSLKGVMAAAGEMNRKLAEMKNCPGPCADGTAGIEMSSGRTVKAPCPLIGPACAYGARMEQGLDRYITGVMAGIGVPLRHRENLPGRRRTDVTDEIAGWGVRGFLIFFGGTGTGKSFGAALAVHNYLKSQAGGRYDRKSQEAAERAGNSAAWCAAADIAGDREAAARARQAFLTVIDDLGGEAGIPAGQAAVRGLILKRYDMKQPTVITAALTMLDIDALYGSRIADRLTEDIGSGGKIIDCGAVSMRSPAAFFTAGGERRP